MPNLLKYDPSLFRKRRTGCLLAVTGAASLNVHVIGVTFVICIVNAFHSLTVDADGGTGMNRGTLKRIHPLSLLHKTLTASTITIAGTLSAHHDVAFTA